MAQAKVATGLEVQVVVQEEVREAAKKETMMGQEEVSLSFFQTSFLARNSDDLAPCLNSYEWSLGWSYRYEITF